MLKIADNLNLPLDVVTEKLAWLGRTGSGKTYGATKLAELLLAARAQVVALDPVGVWPGLRMPGPGAAFSAVYVFGGLYGDFPLAATGGALMADVVVDRAISAVLDVSQFIASEQTRFAYDFATRFFQRKKSAPSAVHLFLEECQEFVPQNPQRDETRLLHAFERLWKLGRNFGIGGSLISQRPQEVNKKALNQAGTLFVFQMTGPQERKAIKGWVSEQGINEDIDAVLPKLRVGEPHVWSPTFLGVSKTVRILPKQTADISSTPKIGARSAERPLTPVDVKKLAAAMADTVERAKADDPRELRRQVAELQRQLAAKPAAEVRTVEKPVLAPEQAAQLDALTASAHALTLRAGDIGAVLAALHEDVRRVADLAAGLRAGVAAAVAPPRATSLAPAPHASAGFVPRAPRQRQAPAAPARRASEGSVALPVGERLVLTACAQHEGCARDQLSILTGYKRSTRDAYIQRLRERGLVEVCGDQVHATAAGVDALGPDFEPLPVGDALRAYWMARLPDGERRVLEVVCAGHPRAVERTAIDEATEYRRSTRDAYIQRLTARRLVASEGRGAVRASEALFG